MPFINRIGSGSTRKFGFGAGMKPDAPTIGTATAGSLQASVAFTPAAMTGTGIPTYTATSSPGGFTASGAGSPLVVTGLANGTAYTFTVTASNAFGSSTSAASNSVTPFAAPSAPAAPTASLPSTYGNTTAALSWTAPANNGSAITDYVIQYSSNAGSTWTTFTDGVSTATSTTVTGLTNGTAYVFRVAAVNLAQGDYSPASNSVTPLFGKVPTPTFPYPTSTTSSVTTCFSNYNDIDQSNGYVYNYYGFNVVPNDQAGICHGWTGKPENTNFYTYLYVSKTGWANSDAVYITESTNSTPPPPPPPPVDPCAGNTCSAGTFITLNPGCPEGYLGGIFTGVPSIPGCACGDVAEPCLPFCPLGCFP